MVVLDKEALPHHITIGIDDPLNKQVFILNLTIVIKVLVLGYLGTAAYTALRSIRLWETEPPMGCPFDCPPPPPTPPPPPPPPLIGGLDSVLRLFALVSLVLLIIAAGSWFFSRHRSQTLSLPILNAW
jgi:hypothetical protein